VNEIADTPENREIVYKFLDEFIGAMNTADTANILFERLGLEYRAVDGEKVPEWFSDSWAGRILLPQFFGGKI
jgi:hypothetical protein